jgi:CheY-like chemotaxis protein
VCGVRPLGVILVVEDEWLLRDDIVTELTADGWHVLEARSGERAVALLAEHAIDAVFTDIQLAGVLSGWDVAEACRRSNAATPVLYTSGTASDRSRQVPDSVFFDKPYRASDVLDACRQRRQS